MAENVKNASERGLFEVIAINLNTDEIVFEQKIVAEGENEALFESNIKEALKEKGLNTKEVHKIVREIASVPARIEIKKVTLLSKIGNIIHGEESSKK